MSMSTIALEGRREGLAARLSDLYQLTRPRIALLELVTVSVGAVVAAAGIPAEPIVLLHAIVGTTLLAASASMINQWLECETDRLMPRTADRPLPAGRVSPAQVVGLGMFSGIAGVLYLIALVNLATALLGLVCWTLYTAVYTPLKFRTPANTFVGAIAGAIPVLMGWTAVSGSFAGPQGILAATLFLVVFLWQFPHFMAIAWLYRHDYQAAGVRVIPTVDPTGRRAGAQAVMAALVLIPITLLPAVLLWTLDLSAAYFAGALSLGLMQAFAAIRFALSRDDATARRLLHATLIYLPVLFGLLLMVPLMIPRAV
ncbi:MAG: protoheme IX farnesyltransferase [Planctomycetota bacterium]|nr:MAG: protoheme IX farnesyltransferase [Planctomycetota bacterium]REK40707.1 MAG: protoheme IX farnesyltransferase [Planctomycetota bacterium]